MVLVVCETSTMTQCKLAIVNGRKKTLGAIDVTHDACSNTGPRNRFYSQHNFFSKL